MREKNNTVAHENIWIFIINKLWLCVIEINYKTFSNFVNPVTKDNYCDTRYTMIYLWYLKPVKKCISIKCV